jgi:hypothetical protein
MRPWRPSQDGAFLQSESSLRESFSLLVLTMIPNQNKSARVFQNLNMMNKDLEVNSLDY